MLWYTVHKQALYLSELMWAWVKIESIQIMKQAWWPSLYYCCWTPLVHFWGKLPTELPWQVCEDHRNTEKPKNLYAIEGVEHIWWSILNCQWIKEQLTWTMLKLPNDTRKDATTHKDVNKQNQMKTLTSHGRGRGSSSFFCHWSLWERQTRYPTHPPTILKCQETGNCHQVDCRWPQERRHKLTIHPVGVSNGS